MTKKEFLKKTIWDLSLEMSKKNDIEDAISTAIWFENHSGGGHYVPERVYISFSRKYKTGILTRKQANAIIDELTPVMFPIIIKKLQEYHLLPSHIKRPGGKRHGSKKHIPGT